MCKCTFVSQVVTLRMTPQNPHRIWGHGIGQTIDQTNKLQDCIVFLLKKWYSIRLLWKILWLNWKFYRWIYASAKFLLVASDHPQLFNFDSRELAPKSSTSSLSVFMLAHSLSWKPSFGKRIFYTILCLSVFSGGSCGQLRSVCVGARCSARPPQGAGLPVEVCRLELHFLLWPAGSKQEPCSAASSDCSSQHGPHRGQHTFTHTHKHS